MNTMTRLALGFFIPVLGQTLPTEVPVIEASLRECERRQNSLFCDFQGSSIDTIYLDRTNETFGIIYVYNIAKLHLNHKSCTNLALNNIGRVEIAEKELLVDYTCSRAIKLTAKDTLFSEIPGNAKEIDLENCTLLSWTTVSSLTKASILNSRVEVLNASEPLMNAASFMVDGSSIGILQKLVLNGSEFSMKSTKIDFISPGGFVVQRGLAKLENCSFQNASVDSFLIHPKATLLLENLSGNLRISHTGKSSDVENTANEKDFYTEFVVVLAVLVITMVSCLGIIFVYCIKERTRSQVPGINDAKFQNKDEQISLLDKNSPSETNRSSKKDLDNNREREILTNQGASREGDDAMSKEQLTAPPYQDDVSDKVIIFKCYYLAGQDCEIGDLLRKGKIKIALS
ncbi:uncharacterized protein LOC135225112, partial [Macrobrachium nipponense]|uniref:uncharacterized protein LOC135225112 n=1 Tax=Macrobrachium nipponense TaxID=159736 RepID=UPI0030C82A99